MLGDIVFTENVIICDELSNFNYIIFQCLGRWSEQTNCITLSIVILLEWYKYLPPTPTPQPIYFVEIFFSQTEFIYYFKILGIQRRECGNSIDQVFYLVWPECIHLAWYLNEMHLYLGFSAGASSAKQHLSWLSE